MAAVATQHKDLKGGKAEHDIFTTLLNDSLRQAFTKEMFDEVQEVFQACCDGTGVIPLNKLPLALKTMGMSVNECDPLILHNVKNVDIEIFAETVLSCMKQPNWAANEMNEAFSLFDRDDTATISPANLRVVFTRLGENLLEKELQDQIREFDMDGDLEMAVAEFYKMVNTTRGSDYDFDDTV